MRPNPPKARKYQEFRRLLDDEESCPCPDQLTKVIEFVEEKKFSPNGAAAIIEAFGAAIDFATQGDPEQEKKLKGKAKNFTVDCKTLTEDFLALCEKFWHLTWEHQPLAVRGNPRAVSKDMRIKRAGMKSRIVLEIIAERMNVPHRYEIASPEEPLAKTGS